MVPVGVGVCDATALPLLVPLTALLRDGTADALLHAETLELREAEAVLHAVPLVDSLPLVLGVARLLRLKAPVIETTGVGDGDVDALALVRALRVVDNDAAAEADADTLLEREAVGAFDTVPALLAVATERDGVGEMAAERDMGAVAVVLREAKTDALTNTEAETVPV